MSFLNTIGSALKTAGNATYHALGKAGNVAIGRTPHSDTYGAQRQPSVNLAAPQTSAVAAPPGLGSADEVTVELDALNTLHDHLIEMQRVGTGIEDGDKEMAVQHAKATLAGLIASAPPEAREALKTALASIQSATTVGAVQKSVDDATASLEKIQATLPKQTFGALTITKETAVDAKARTVLADIKSASDKAQDDMLALQTEYQDKPMDEAFRKRFVSIVSTLSSQVDKDIADLQSVAGPNHPLVLQLKGALASPEMSKAPGFVSLLPSIVSDMQESLNTRDQILKQPAPAARPPYGVLQRRAA